VCRTVCNDGEGRSLGTENILLYHDIERALWRGRGACADIGHRERGGLADCPFGLASQPCVPHEHEAATQHSTAVESIYDLKILCGLSKGEKFEGPRPVQRGTTSLYR
jgi:hypothetical protein